MSERVMYVKPGCPYCAEARDSLTEQGLEWEERDATANRDWREELFAHSNGSGVVPTIVGPDGVQVGWEGRG
ncbi:MAG: glutaredoxin [Thermoleophilaceae bacterium]|jgi:glutaredoxin|nr:glutaredoxin [Thermoleophilaceae bacterium]